MINTANGVDTAKAIETLRKGGVVLCPTDTVWALMCDFENAEAVESIHSIKQGSRKPMAVLCDSLDCIDNLKVEFTLSAQKLADAFWPGPLTLILKSHLAGIGHITGENNSLGIRIPDSKKLIELINRFGCPVAATSANIYSHEPSIILDDIPVSIQSEVDCIWNSDISPLGKASTVIDCTHEKFRLIREGALSSVDIRKITGRYDR